MKKVILALVGAGLMAGSLAANASPENDRKQVINTYKKAYPKIKLDQYVHGAMIYDAGAMEQYQTIMDFPPFEGVIEAGKAMWEKPFANGKTYAECFPNGGKNQAGNYPLFDDKAGKVVTFEMAVNACREANGEKPLDYSGKEIGKLTSYARTLSDGMKMNVKVKGTAALAAFERGKAFFYQRRGQLNFSCATCHQDNAGHRIRSEFLSPALGQATHWPAFRGGDNLVTLQQRYKGCNKQVRAVPLKPGSTEFNELEYFHSYLSNGLPMKASVFRK